LFEDNQIHNNDKIGILLSRNLTDTVVRNNNISQTRAGISVSESHDNAIYNNTVVDSEFPIALKAGSANNTIVDNRIINTVNCGILVYKLAEDNNIALNKITDSRNDGLCVNQGAEGNRFYSNIIDSANRYGISVRGRDSTENIFENNTIQLAKNGIIIHNNTDTMLVNNLMREIIGNEYTIAANSTLNLEKTLSPSFKIRSNGPIGNIVNIKDSGKLEVFTTGVSGTDQSIGETYIYDSDIRPYFERILAATVDINRSLQ
jgi:parallel beta-helix repeat protein